MKEIIFIISFSCFILTGGAQNVGIGITTPPAKLTAVGSYGSPSIPNTTSTGIFRIGILDNEGIDFGKMGSPPYAGWIQVGFGGTGIDPLSLQPMGGNVGIGTSTPGANLEVVGGVKVSDSMNIGGQVRITSGTPGAGKVLTSDANGLASWTTPAVSGSHFIGESYGGGIVFYVYDNGQHGLIAATTDQSTSMRWYGGGYTNTRAKADGVGAGLKNTTIIIANQGPVDGNAFAATVCNEYSVTVNGVTYGDWYLPSKHELNLLYLQKSVVGGFANTYYWSSSEYNDNAAWLQEFLLGDQAMVHKSFTAVYVRAVRAF